MVELLARSAISRSADLESSMIGGCSSKRIDLNSAHTWQGADSNLGRYR
jgi:hypothetical protein